MSYRTILYEEDGPVGTVTLNRPDDGNMFTIETCHEVRDCIEGIRRETPDARDRADRRGGQVLLYRRTQGRGGAHPPLCRHAADARDVRGDRQAPEAGDRERQRVRGRRRQRAPDGLRPHHRQGERGLPPGRPDDGVFRRGLRHLVSRRPRGQEAGQGNLVHQPQDRGRRGARDGADQPRRARRRARRADAGIRPGGGRARQLRAGLDQGCVQRPPRRRIGACPDGARSAAAGLSRQRGVEGARHRLPRAPVRPTPTASDTERHGRCVRF